MGYVNTADIVGEEALEDGFIMRTLTEFCDDRIVKVRNDAFRQCKSMSFVDLPSVTDIGSAAFYECSALVTVIIRTESLCALGSTSVFSGTPISSGDGFVYVPAALVSAYKTATNWSAIADQIRAIEDYPEITGGV